MNDKPGETHTVDVYCRGKVASILKYAKCLIHIDLCPVAIHRFEKSVNKKKDKLIKKNIVHNTVGDPMKDR